MSSSLPFSSRFNYWTLRLLPQSSRTVMGRTTCCFQFSNSNRCARFCLLFLPVSRSGSISSAWGDSAYIVSKDSPGIKKIQRRLVWFLPCCKTFSPSSHPFPLLCLESNAILSLHYHVNIPVACISTGDWLIGNWKCNKTRAEFELNSKEKSWEELVLGCSAAVGFS